MGYQVHSKFADSETYETVENLDVANKLIKRDLARGAKSSEAIVFKGKSPEPWKQKGPLNKAAASGRLNDLLVKAGSIDSGVAQQAQAEIRDLVTAQTSTAEFDTEAAGMKIANAVYQSGGNDFSAAQKRAAWLASAHDAASVSLEVQDAARNLAKAANGKDEEAAKEEYARTYAKAYAEEMARSQSR